ncbi:MAG: Rpn family recombination-promoting nuclease/putative transposase [Chthoniobacterales bacterium]|nr:Rpn family recombination-promoting nuclease/putative transposase [Chthoniobacterales bacterium]
MSSIIPNPHDRFFRASMSNPRVALQFVEKHIPLHIAAKIDKGSLQMMPGNFIEDLQEWKTDLLFKVTFQGTFGYIYLLVEHQRKSEQLMPLRMLEYVTKIIRMHLQENGEGPLPLVYPCVLYNGSEPYVHTTDVFELFQDPDFAREIFLKPFQLIDLTQLSDDDLKKESLLGIMEILLKHAFARDTISLIRKISDLLQQADKMQEVELLRESAEYVFQTTKDNLSKHAVLNEFKKHLSPPTQKNIMTLAEAFVEEGRQEGMQKSRQEERQKFRSLLIKQLKNRFPNQVTAHYLNLIQEADSDKLFYWCEKLITAMSVEEVFSCL